MTRLTESTALRRVVTGHDPQGRSRVSEDSIAVASHTQPGRVGYRRTDLWRTQQAPANVSEAGSPGPAPLPLAPSAGGSLARIVEFGPEGDWLDALAAASGKEGHPFLHRTETLDYAIVLDGEITLVLDLEEVSLKQGDFVVERGTRHAWANRSGKPCRMLFVMIDAVFEPALARAFAADSSSFRAR